MRRRILIVILYFSIKLFISTDYLSVLFPSPFYPYPSLSISLSFSPSPCHTLSLSQLQNKGVRGPPLRGPPSPRTPLSTDRGVRGEGVRGDVGLLGECRIHCKNQSSGISCVRDIGHNESRSRHGIVHTQVFFASM